MRVGCVWRCGCSPEWSAPCVNVAKEMRDAWDAPARAQRAEKRARKREAEAEEEARWRAIRRRLSPRVAGLRCRTLCMGRIKRRWP